MDKVYFSASMPGFILAAWKDDGTYTKDTWPQDAVLLKDDEVSQFWKQTAPEGKTIGSVEGRPAWVSLPAPTHEEMVAAAEQQQQSLINEAMQSISVIQLKLQAGRALSATESGRLNAVLDYIDRVSIIDTSLVPDIVWPDSPF
ncbi:TPA: tail fiber assembly protein [Escherichia coli]|nr:tail fiber assembly protein [Escherichia coli]